MSNTEKLTRYESAEALAKDVESKWKLELAQRIRDIEKSSIEQKTANWLETLKNWLNAEEESQLRETIDDTDTKLSFSEWLQTEERIKLEWKKQAEQILWKDKTWMFSKIENLFSRFELAWQKASESFAWGNFLAAIWVFFWVLKWSINTSENENNINLEKSTWDLDLNNTMHAQYYSAIKWIYLFAWRDLKAKSNNLLISENIYNKSFSTLNNEFKKPEWIAKRLWFNDVNNNDQRVISSIEIILKSQKTIDNCLKSEKQNWRDLPLIDVIPLLDKKWLNSLNNIHEWIENWKWEISDILKQIENNLSLNSDQNWELNFWWLESRKDLIQWVNKWFLTKIITTWKDSSFKTWDDWAKETILNTENRNNEKNVELIDKLITFKDEFLKSSKVLFREENQKDIESFYQNNWVSLKEIFELYLITWWNPDIKSLNWITQSLVILKLLGIYSKDKENWTRWILLNNLQEQISTPDLDFISPETKELIKNMILKSTDILVRNLKWFVKDLWEALTPEQLAIVWTAIGWVILLWSKLAWVKWATTWVVWSAIWGWWIYLYLSSQDNLKSILEKYNVNSEEELTSLIKNTK